MYRCRLATLLLLSQLVVVGCTSSTSPPASTLSESNETVSDTAATPQSVADAAANDEVAETLATGTSDSESVLDSPADSAKSLEAYREDLQSLFAQLSENPSPAGMDAAIEKAREATQQYPDNEELIRIKTVLLYHSLRVERDPQTLTDRRLELGKLARDLAERNKEQPEQLGNLPMMLLFEESKGYIAQDNLSKAWESITEAKNKGFNQSQVLFMDPTFEPLLEIEEYKSELNAWIKDDIVAQMETFESFPLFFSLPQLNADEEGKELSLADFKGKPVIVDFWGTWCPPCRAALPHLVDLHNKHKDELAVVGINFEDRVGASNFDETKQVFDEFVESTPLPYPCLYGQSSLTAQVPGFRGFPTMVFVDKTGRVRLSLTGYNPAPVLEAITDILLAE